MSMKLFIDLKPEVLFISMPTQMQVRLVADEKTVQKLRTLKVGLNDTRVYCLVKLLAFGLVGFSLRFKSMHFEGKRFQIVEIMRR